MDVYKKITIEELGHMLSEYIGHDVFVVGIDKDTITYLDTVESFEDRQIRLKSLAFKKDVK